MDLARQAGEVDGWGLGSRPPYDLIDERKGKKMRSYPVNSAPAAGRILALTIISDGNFSPDELQSIGDSRILQHLELGELEFRQIVQELCNDLSVTAHHGGARIEPSLIDPLLGEIVDSDLRRKLLQAMWRIADADCWLSDGEAVILSRAAVAWGAENSFL